MKNLSLLLMLLPFTVFSQSQSRLNFEKLKICVNQIKFQDAFDVCDPVDLIYDNRTIYNNTKCDFSESRITLECASELNIVNSKIDLDKDSEDIGGICKKGKIVLIGFEKVDDYFLAAFFNTCNKSFVNVRMNDKNEVIKISSGVY